MKTLTFKETLAIVEEFMIASKIRQYCTEICKGQCCMNCYTDNSNSCRHCEGRRLTCSIYTCYELRCKLSEETRTILIEVGHSIRAQYHKSNIGDVYFKPPDKTFTETARFPMSIKKELKKINIEKVKKVMINLIITEIKIYRR